MFSFLFLTISSLVPTGRAEANRYGSIPRERTLAGTANSRREAETKAREADNNRQAKIVISAMAAMRDKKMGMTTEEIFAFGNENNLEAQHLTQLFTVANQELAQNLSAEQAMVLGKLLAHIDNNPNKYHEGSVRGLIEKNPFLFV